MTNSFDPASIRRPDSRLRNYYLVLGVVTGIIPALPLLAKYFTLQYQFDDTGVSMKWGILFRHEIHLTYRRIQDIHLTRNLLQRWFGLATLSVQTASGSSAPEMKIEGILAAESLRDYLYSKMRGAKGKPNASHHEPTAQDLGPQVTALLSDIRDALQRIAQGDSPVPPAAIAVLEPLASLASAASDDATVSSSSSAAVGSCSDCESAKLSTSGAAQVPNDELNHVGQADESSLSGDQAGADTVGELSGEVLAALPTNPIERQERSHD